MPEIRLEPTEHRYFIDGREKPSVTQILEAEGFIDFGWLDYKPAKDPRFANRGDEVKYRGHWVHAACALLFAGRLRWESLQSAPQWIGYIESCRASIGELGIVPLLIEQPFFNPEDEGGYCGTIDLCAIVQDWITVFDLKSGEKEPWHRLQTGGYRRGLLYLPDEIYPWRTAPHRRATLHLDSDGAPGRIEWHDDTRDIDWFRALVRVHYARRALYGR